jgi:hypothetical protein
MATSEADNDPLLTYREVGALLGVGERAALNWVREHDIPVLPGRPRRVRRGDVVAQARALGRPLADTSEVLRNTSEVFGSVPKPTSEANGSPEPIEASYRVAPEDLQHAIERTGEKYVADFAALYDRVSAELGAAYAGQLAAKDETIATQREALAAQRAIVADQGAALALVQARAEAAEAELAAPGWRRTSRVADVLGIVGTVFALAIPIAYGIQTAYAYATTQGPVLLDQVRLVTSIYASAISAAGTFIVALVINLVANFAKAGGRHAGEWTFRRWERWRTRRK